MNWNAAPFSPGLPLALGQCLHHALLDALNSLVLLGSFELRGPCRAIFAKGYPAIRLNIFKSTVGPFVHVSAGE